MDAIEYRNIQWKVRKLHKHIDPRGCLELLAEESSEVTQAAMKLIRVSEASNDMVYPADKNKYSIKNCEVDLNNEVMDVITCAFLLYADHYDVPNSLMDYDAINERLDKMIARIEENKNE
nr:MAG TPA: triphosphate pyrophosphohydrolase [Caudoviricetes sp.]